jgi:hypothetical protein
MNRLEIGLAFAVLASLALNGSYLFQHHGVSDTAAVDIRRPFVTARGLLSSRIWVIGGAIGVVGVVLHLAALTLAPLAYVQAFLAGGLALLAPVTAIVLGHRLTPAEIAGATLMALALVSLAIGLGSVAPDARFGATTLGSYLAIGAGLAAAVILLAPAARRAHAFGLAAGILYGAGDAAIKALTGILRHHGVGHVLISPWLYATLVFVGVAFFAFQRGLQTGRALPVIAILGGFIVFGDPVGRTTVLSALHVTGFVLVALAAWLLAPAQAAVTVGEQPSEPPRRERTAEPATIPTP